MKGIMKFKKLAAFVLLAAVLVGMVQPRVARAASSLETLFVEQGIEVDWSAVTIDLESYPYYMVMCDGYQGDSLVYIIHLFFAESVTLSPSGLFYQYDVVRNNGKNYYGCYIIQIIDGVAVEQIHKEIFSEIYFKPIISKSVTITDRVGILSTSDVFPTPTPVPEHTHTWTSKESSATCTDTGFTWEECECGEKQNETELPALGHTWEAKEEPGSCTTDSRTWEECSLCSAVQNEVVTPSDGHVWLDKEEPATCTTPGRSWQECACGEVQNDTVLPAFGHSWEQKEQTGNCAVDSKTWEQCTLCSAIQNEVVTPASGHVYDDDDDNVCNVCYYNRNIERLGDFLDMLPKILTLFCIFPLNIYLIINLIILGVILYRSLKKK